MYNKTHTIHFLSITSGPMYDFALLLHQSGYRVFISYEDHFNPLANTSEVLDICIKHEAYLSQQSFQSQDTVVIGSNILPQDFVLQKAKALQVPIMIYTQAIQHYIHNTQRIVIAGPDQEAIIDLAVKVLAYHHRHVDYIFHNNSMKYPKKIQLTGAPIVLIEGDMSIASYSMTALLLGYTANVGFLSGVAWKKCADYPERASFIHTLKNFVDALPKGGTIIYCKDDPSIANMGDNPPRSDIKNVAYTQEERENRKGLSHYADFPHIVGVQKLLRNLGITKEQFEEALST